MQRNKQKQMEMTTQDYKTMQNALREWGFSQTNENRFERKQDGYYYNDEMQAVFSVEFEPNYVRIRVEILPDGKWCKRPETKLSEFNPWPLWNEPSAKANELRNDLKNKGCRI